MVDDQGAKAATISGANLARLLGISPRRHLELVRARILPAAVSRGLYPLVASVQGYCSHLRALASGANDGVGDAGLTAERVKVARAKGAILAMQQATIEGRLVPVDEMETAIVAATGAVKSRLL